MDNKKIKPNQQAGQRELIRSINLILKNPLTAFGLIIILSLFIIAVFAPFLAPFPDQGRGLSNLEERLESPSFKHPMGTDELGRDILSRIIYGTRISLKAAIIVVSVSMVIGVPLGLIAGYFGGKIDDLIMRLADMILAFPSLLLAIAIVASLGPSLINALIAIAIPWWPWYTRLMRSQVISVKEMQFIESAKAIGV